jgi:hypothetical protein
MRCARRKLYRYDYFTEKLNAIRIWETELEVLLSGKGMTGGGERAEETGAAVRMLRPERAG